MTSMIDSDRTNDDLNKLLYVALGHYLTMTYLGLKRFSYDVDKLHRIYAKHVGLEMPTMAKLHQGVMENVEDFLNKPGCKEDICSRYMHTDGRKPGDGSYEPQVKDMTKTFALAVGILACNHLRLKREGEEVIDTRRIKLKKLPGISKVGGKIRTN